MNTAPPQLPAIPAEIDVRITSHAHAVADTERERNGWAAEAKGTDEAIEDAIKYEDERRAALVAAVGELVRERDDWKAIAEAALVGDYGTIQADRDRLRAELAELATKAGEIHADRVKDLLAELEGARTLLKQVFDHGISYGNGMESVWYESAKAALQGTTAGRGK